MRGLKQKISLTCGGSSLWRMQTSLHPGPMLTINYPLSQQALLAPTPIPKYPPQPAKPTYVTCVTGRR
jgi:hypothetical protein